MSQPLPLQGIRVIDYSHFLAGPYVGRCLAGLGAEVIKVERPGSGDAGRQHAFTLDDHQSGYFLQLNMGKRGVSVNMRDPRGQAFMQKLCDSADVFIENYRPGALEKLGLGYAELSARNPKLVYCSISAYGHTGPDAHRAGFGLIAEAKSGIMQMVGNPGEAPPLLRISLGDMYTGIHAVAAINAALLGRVTSGRGQHIDMALYDTLVSMHEYAVQCYTLSNGEILPQQTGHDMPTSTLYGVFRAADGDLVIAAQVDEAWKRFATMLEHNGAPAGFGADTRFHTSSGRNSHRVEILEVVKGWVGARPTAQILALLDEIDVPSAKVQRIDEVIADPQIKARNMIMEQEHPRYGTLRMPNLPFRFSDCDTTIQQVAPDLGQHNAQIAAELGFSEADICAMQADGVLFSARRCAMTDRYSVIGRPISHTKSPLIHGLFAEVTEQDITYGAIEGSLEGFTDQVLTFATEGGRGMNITAPFKLQAFELADLRSERATLARACNALKFEQGKIYAENFDGIGLLRDIQHNLQVPLVGRKVLLLGAGGAVRGALLPFLEAGPQCLVIANRDLDKAHALAAEVNDARVQVCAYPALQGQVFDVVINATSASLSSELPPIAEGLFQQALLAYELAYGKGLTPFLRLAQEAGVAHLADGVGMLVEQAAEAFEWWRGVRPETRPVIDRLTVPLV